MKRTAVYLLILLLFLTGCAAPKADVPANVMAEYRGQQVTEEILAQNIEVLQFLAQGQQPTETEMLEEILENMILLYEAERRGLAATEEEVQAGLDSAARAYEIPESKAALDEYFAEYGLSYDEYIERLRETLPRTIARQKLRDTLGQEYCEKHGLTFTKVNPPEAMTKAVEQTIARLVQSEKRYVTYYR